MLRRLFVPLVYLAVLWAAGASAARADTPEKSASAHASTPEPPNADETAVSQQCRLCGRKAIELDITIPLWLPLVVGTFGYGDSSSELSEHVDFDNSIRFAYMGHLAIRAWGFGIEGEAFGLSMGTDIRFTFDERNRDIGAIDLSGAIARLSASYAAPPIRLGRKKEPFLLGFTPYAGTRFHSISVDASHGDGHLEEHTYPWWFALVGTALDVDFRMGLSLHAEFDVGGFDLDHNIGWWTSAALQYMCTDWLGLALGYNFYRVERQITVANTPLDLRVQFHGPVLTIGFYIHE